MARPVTLLTGQWADPPFATLCQKLRARGYDGAEIARWGDHLDVRKAASDDSGTERELGAKEALELVRRVDFAPSAPAEGEAMKIT
jgi:hypothetical protein